MSSFELNSKLYTKPEIEDLLSLSYPYTVENVEEQKKILFVEFSKDKMLQQENKAELITFIESIAGVLVRDLISTEESKLELGYTKTKSTSDEMLPYGNSENTSFLRNNSNVLYRSNEHDVIINEKAEEEAEKASLNDGLKAYETGAPPGIINPLQYRTITRAVNIDSRFRPNYYSTSSSSSDMHLTLPTRLDKVVSMRLGALELPATFYAISKELGNNSFTITLAESSVTKTITIPDGNYPTSTSIIQAITTAIPTTITNSDGSAVAGGIVNYDVDPASGKSTFTNNTTETLTITFGVNSEGSISDDQLPLLLGWQLGFRNNVYIIKSGQVAISEGLCQVSGPRYVFLTIDDYNNNVNNFFISAFSDSTNSRNILTRIDFPFTYEDAYGSQINRTRTYFGPVTIEKMHIQLIDEYGRIVNMNNMDWSFSLMFECVY
jgi:hypothetical protein